jgi:hypothetical protein
MWKIKNWEGGWLLYKRIRNGEWNKCESTINEKSEINADDPT